MAVVDTPHEAWSVVSGTVNGAIGRRRHGVMIAAVVVATHVSFAATAQTAPVTFFGEDTNPAGSGTLSSTPNSDQARASFFANLQGVGTETFESIPTGTVDPTVVFPGAGTATLIGSGDVESGPSGSDQYPISGTQYYNAGSSNFSISFSAPVAAFGFYGTDIGDFQGQLILTLAEVGGGSQSLTVPNSTEMNITDGSALYFGFYNTSTQYTGITFGNTNSNDVFGFDDFSVGSVTQVRPSATIDTTDGDIAPNVFSLGSPAATAATVVFQGGTLRMTGGAFPGNIITAPVTLTASNGTVDTSPADGGFSGVVSGPGSLTVIGTHTFSLTGNNTYAGGTFLQGGTLLVGSDTALGTGVLTMSDGTTLQETVGVTLGNDAVLNGRDTFETSDTQGLAEGLIYDGAISGTGTLVKTGATGLRLTAANTYTGGTIIADGHVAVANNASLGTGTVTFAGGFLRVIAGGLTITNPAELQSDGRIDTRSFDTTYAGAISGAGQLTKTGIGTLTLSNANSYTGGTTILAGTLAATNNDAIGSGALTFGTSATGNTGTFQAAAPGLAFANNVVLASAGTVDTQANDLTLSGTVSGAGMLTKTGSGTLALPGFNSYGGGTTINAGTILVTASYEDPTTQALFQAGEQMPSTHGSIPDAVTLVNNGATILSSVGYGPVTLNGGGLRFSTSYNGINLDNAIVVAPGGGTLDSGGLNYVDLRGGLSDSAAGTGTLVFTNSGTGGPGHIDFSLFRTSSFTGGNLIEGNTFVQSNSNNALGTGALQVNAGGIFDLSAFDQSVTRLSGDGTVMNSGYGSLGIVSTLSVQGGSFAGTLKDGTSTNPYNSVVSSGILALAKVSDGTATGGTLLLSGTSTYSGPTSVQGGILQAGSTTALSARSAFTIAGGATLDLGGFSSTVASVAGAGTVTNQGSTAATLTAGGDNTSTAFGGLLSDGVSALSLVKTGTGTLSVTGRNTYTGGTAVLAGTLAVGSDTALGTGALTLDDLTELQFTADGIHLANPIALSGSLDPVIDTGSGSQTISGPITGPGALTKIGSGTLDLTGTNTYTGATEIAAGTLLADGSIVNSTVTVDSGAFLGGSGSIQAAVVKSGATLNLGAQTLSVTSDVSFLTGSTYQVTINPDGTGSKLSIGRTASIGGATLNVLAGSGTFSARTYELLTAAAGVSGTFGTVDLATNLALLRPQVNYGANDVALTLNPVDFRTIAATSNQAATAGAIQALGQNSPLYSAVLSLDRPQAQQAFASASGVSHAAPTAIVASLNRLSTGLLIDRLWDVTGSGLSAQQVLDQFAPDRMPALVRCYGPVADPVPAPKPPSYTAWGEAFGTFGHTDGGANSGALDRTLGGFVLGLDTPFQGILQDKWRGGVAVGYTNTSYTSHLDGGTGTLQGVFGSLYAGARYGAVDVRVGTTVGGTFTDARRTVAFPGFMESEKSSNDGYSVQTFGEVGYRIPANGFVFEPVAGLSFLHSHQDGFNEKGGAAALTVGAVDNDLGTTSVGFRTEMQPFKDLPIIAHAFLAWQHVIGNVSPATTLAFEAAPAGTFSITGTPIDRDALVAEVAMDYRVSTALDIGLSYSGQVGPTAYDHSVKGRFEYRF